MDINTYINRGFELFKRQCLIEDPNCTVTMTATPIKQIQNNPVERALADVRVVTKGVDYKYSLTYNQMTGKFSNIPIN
tara:strand:- start:125 stop:358 length:234 start_codon:yes stop_codon:yes gene_type:complete